MWTYIQWNISLNTDNFQRHMGMYTHCRCSCGQIFQSSLSLRDFQSLISVHICPYVFKAALQRFHAHLNRMARHGAEVPVLTGSGEAPLPPCCTGMNSLCWWGVTNCSSPPHSQGSAAPGLEEELRSAQGCVDTLSPGPRHPYHLWWLAEAYHNSH